MSEFAICMACWYIPNLYLEMRLLSRIKGRHVDNVLSEIMVELGEDRRVSPLRRH